MGGAVHWLVTFDVKEGQFDGFKAVMNDLVSATMENEPGTTHYEWFASDDGRHLHLYERYRDSADAMKHLKTFDEKFATRLFATVDPTGVVIYGNPSSEVVAALGDLAPVVMGQIGGFTRLV
jgi:quinol monooxygenase YgiN